MLNTLFVHLEWHVNFILIFTLIFVLIYEAINGFHDTANSVTTVIYTHALNAQVAVFMSGIFNFLGVLIGGVSVAYSIVHLLPINLLFNISSTQGLIMIFSILLAAIFWNLGTWYFALPTSSSHTLVGSIIGVSLTNALANNNSIKQALNIPKLIEIIISLILSPVIGFVLAGFMLLVMRYCWNHSKKTNNIHLTPLEREQKDGKYKPPFYIRVALILSAAGVSFSHGSNDGQKGIGLIMLMLICAAPMNFVVNINASSYDIKRTHDAVNHLHQYYIAHQNKLSKYIISNNIPVFSSKIQNDIAYNKLIFIMQNSNCNIINNDKTINQDKKIKTNKSCTDLLKIIISAKNILLLLNNINNYNQLDTNERFYIRYVIMCIADITDKIIKLPDVSNTDKRFLIELKKDLLKTFEYAPLWIIIAVASSLSLGTMISWRRVSTTIGEKIGKKSMTYAQGLSAQTTAAISIGIASYTGIPVSTTHVLSSAVVGTMLCNGNGVQNKTIKNIFTAWMLTMPITIIIASLIYWFIIKITEIL